MEEDKESKTEVQTVNDVQPESLPSSDIDHQPENLVPHTSNNDGAEFKSEINDKDVIRVLEDIAATGRFRHDWDTLKSMLLFRLKQVLAEYPESQSVASAEPQQNSVPGETYPELVQRLNEELLSFIEGPPFTLQRLCEILLSPKDIYPKLSKLALALEKNLLVTSTIGVSSDPYPQTEIEHSVQTGNGSEVIHKEDNPVQNGVDKVEGDTDVEMVDAETSEAKLEKEMGIKEDSDMGIKEDMLKEEGCCDAEIKEQIYVEPREEKAAVATEGSSMPMADSSVPTESTPITEDTKSTDAKEP